uniref:Glycosyltransferase n=1 Tax=Panax ginseng TaxID=4054 RepID=A0A7G3KFN9_PANGI|nr:UGT85K23 [Panax ginseng]
MEEFQIPVVMNSNSAQKPHIVCVPFPAQGHIIPMMQLAKLLHSRGFHITFVNSEHNQRRLIRSKGPEWVAGFDDFRFETIPEGLLRIDPTKSHFPVAVFESVPKTCLAPFRDLLIKLKSTAEVPAITSIIADGVMGFTIKAGIEFGIPVVQFWTASACGFMGYFQYPELIKRGLFPFKDQSFRCDGSLDAKVDWIPGMRNIRLKDIPSFIQTTDPNDISFNFLREEVQNCLKASALIFNTFDAFEHEVLQAISSMFPHIYTVGPIPLLSKGIPESQLQSFRPSLWIEDTKCLEWLDKREPNSVVYVNYGSITKMTDHHLKEFAWGLANSKHPFLWIVRDNIIMGDSAILSEDFLEATKDRSLLTSWCQQDQVLSHSSIGVYLTHCGWNSTLETICAGVPIICWPFFAEQQTNCRYSCTDQWGIGVEVNHDVKRDEIEALVKEMMEGDKGKQLKKKAVEWKKMAEEATSVGGSSYSNFDRLIEEALQPRND